jgi:hypothetical protein
MNLLACDFNLKPGLNFDTFVFKRSNGFFNPGYHGLSPLLHFILRTVF